MPEYKLTYFPIRGLAEQMRLLFIDNGIPFTDDKIKFEEWKNLKATMQFGQVPCLFEDGMQICQSGAIMRHLARKHDLYGSTEEERTFSDLVYEGVKDLHAKYSVLIYQTYKEKKGEYISNFLPVELAKFEKLLKSKNDGKGFVLGGDKPCFVDYTLYEELDIHQVLDPNCLNNFTTLKAYHSRMQSRPNLQTYLASTERKNMKINGNDNQ